MVNYVFLSVYFYSVPNLRFSNPYKLRKVRLGDICTITGGYAFDSHKMKQQGEYQIIKMGNLYNGIFDLSRNQSFINAPTKKELEYLIQKNDILITLTGTTNKKDYGYTVQIEKPKKLLLNQRCALIRASKVNEKYLFYLLNSNDFLKQFYASSTGGTGNQTNVSINDMLDFKVYISNENDQLKISNILNALDKKISTQIKIIEEYVILKNSLIHRFFTMDNPKVKLSTILTEINIKNKNKQIDTVLSVSNKLGFIKQSEQFEDREVASDDTSNYKIVNKGDYAYNPARINVGSIARLINYDKGIISPMYSCFKINEKKITYTYFDMFLSSFSFKRQLNKKLEGSVRQCLTFEGMLSMDIELPCIETQKSISNKIDMLNYKIKLESDYREALIKQKQFLLNNMFI